MCNIQSWGSYFENVIYILHITDYFSAKVLVIYVTVTYYCLHGKSN